MPETITLINENITLRLIAELGNILKYDIHKQCRFQRVQLKELDIDSSSNPLKEVEIILLSELTEKVLDELNLGSVSSKEQEMLELEQVLKKIGALVSLKDNHETNFLRLDVLISALKIHGYTFGDLTIDEGGVGSKRVNLGEISSSS